MPVVLLAAACAYLACDVCSLAPAARWRLAHAAHAMPRLPRPPAPQQLVETAMLAAITGLAYTVGHLLRLEGYLAYGLPLPVVLAALRSGPGAAVKTLATTCLLLLSERRRRGRVAGWGAGATGSPALLLLPTRLAGARHARLGGRHLAAPTSHRPRPPTAAAVLMGPVRAATYLLVYGVLSLALGLSWAARLPWAASVPLGALARIAGYFAYIGLSSWLTNENLVALMVTNVYALLDQLSGVLGTSGAPPPLAVAVVLCSLLFVNSLMYVALMVSEGQPSRAEVQGRRGVGGDLAEAVFCCLATLQAPASKPPTPAPPPPWMQHVLYAIILRALGLGVQLRTPRFMERFVAASSQPAM